LQLATAAADIGTFDFFPSTGELQFSERSRQMFGIPPETKLTYETYLNAVHPDDRHIVHETVARVRQPKSSGRFDIEYRTIGLADGKERWVAERGQRCSIPRAGDAIYRNNARDHGSKERRDPVAARQKRSGRS